MIPWEAGSSPPGEGWMVVEDDYGNFWWQGPDEYAMDEYDEPGGEFSEFYQTAMSPAEVLPAQTPFETFAPNVGTTPTGTTPTVPTPAVTTPFSGGPKTTEQIELERALALMNSTGTDVLPGSGIDPFSGEVLTFSPQGPTTQEFYDQQALLNADQPFNEPGGPPGSEAQTLQDMFIAAGIPWGQRTPAQEFTDFATQYIRPGPSGLRSAFYGMQNPLMQQYYLQQPLMPDYGGFGDFMSGGYAGQQDVRGMAEQAAAMARMPQAQFSQYFNPQTDYAGPALTPEMRTTLGTMTPEQQIMYRDIYGTGENAATNQLQLANLMALQRQGGGGFYGGGLGRAITSSLGELAQQQQARDPGGNFLDWYLKRTAGTGATPGGFLTA